MIDPWEKCGRKRRYMIKNQCITNGLLQSVEVALLYDPVRRLENIRQNILF